MSVAKHATREYSIHDKDTSASDNGLSLIRVIELVPDLSNDELCSIVDLEVTTSIDISTNIIVIRTK
ncbi:hypothetical protein pEaSNUABM49_00016 [Erwinia phage pEa_SNUABM_49]|nr:hypothetical protein pEaSNUABM49_00016 [Erwinia phage pEa_SNUABM_49]